MVMEMAAIDTTLKRPPPDKDKREFRATVCALCVWVIVFAFCWVFLTMEHVVEGIGAALAYLVMGLFAVVFLFISIYKIGRAILNLYKNR